MRFTRTRILGVGTVSMLIAVGALSATSRHDTQLSTIAFPRSGVVERVVDGDTFVLRDGRRHTKVRIIGVDTPETHTNSGIPNCYGAQAFETTNSLLLNHRVRLSREVELHDKYGRILADVRTDDGHDIAASLLRTGAARTLTIPPNNTRSTYLHGLQMYARNHGIGLWSACGFARAFPDKIPS